MQIRPAIASIASIAFVTLLSHAAAFAQTSPVGSWKSATVNNPHWPSHNTTVLLTINDLGADQRVTGRFSVNSPGASGGGGYNCPTGTVSGTFDGTVLKVASKGSNLCAERNWEMKVSGDEMSGTYRGQDGNEIPMTYTRR
ncbi:hypothetical protein [Ramlibacter albus]|uniref:META domain-containing protein n=1 Tax=Ramlibacter albus TaxID=2079448 RepID=A0A923S3A8_9BURK|nr:hypothetical protein [Ramlibacter albus]MBC5766250.1 hypothetical protein [Ramlibacter albus]